MEIREEKRERERRVRGERRGGMGGEGSREVGTKGQFKVREDCGKGAYKTTERTAEPRNGGWRIRHNW